jgi:acetylornithine deacetylase/succinyl-diaminopimelate desuccinylase-like protein
VIPTSLVTGRQQRYGQQVGTIGDDAVEMLRELLQIDTSNPGDNSGPGEIVAARWASEKLAEVGIEAEIYTTTAEHRAGVSALLPGADPTRAPLLLTGHLDVVPADPEGWTHPPFSGYLDDEGVIWGRGAVDMKDMVAMILAVVRGWARDGYTPPRPVALLLTPDEEAGGRHGAHWIVEHRPELLHGATEGIGEVGGYSVHLPNGGRIYPVQVGEKGIAWMTVTVTGTAGHGSLVHSDNPVELLVRAVTEIASHSHEVELTPAMVEFVSTLEAMIGEELALHDLVALKKQIGSLSRVLGAATRNTANPTMLSAGIKHNVVPGQATAGIDVRYLPGHQDSIVADIRRFLPESSRIDFANYDIALETTFDGEIPEAIVAVLGEYDPEARVVPYLMTGGTDAKAFSKLGVRYFGFSPLLLDPDEEFWAMFHGVDERVPADGLRWGTEVLDAVLRRLD